MEIRFFWTKCNLCPVNDRKWTCSYQNHLCLRAILAETNSYIFEWFFHRTATTPSFNLSLYLYPPDNLVYS